MREVVLKRASLSTLLAIIEAMPNERYSSLLYRGQANSAWSLTPSLFREEKIDLEISRLLASLPPRTKEKTYSDLEDRLIRKFFRHGLPYLPQFDRNYHDDRVIAQHFGVPTRLLDWSYDPLVALYFAVEDQSKDSDAAMFALCPYASLVYIEGQLTENPNKFDVIDPVALDGRIIAQKSVLTLHPYGDPDQKFIPVDQREVLASEKFKNTTRPESFLKIVIPAKHKLEILKKLNRIGFNRRTLFPGLDSVGAHLATEYKFNNL